MCLLLFVLLCCRLFFLMIRRPPRSTRTDTLFPYTTLFRSSFRRYRTDFLEGSSAVERVEEQSARPRVIVPASRPVGAAEELEGRVRSRQQREIEKVQLCGQIARTSLGDETEAIGRSEERRVGKESVRTCVSGW